MKYSELFSWPYDRENMLAKDFYNKVVAQFAKFPFATEDSAISLCKGPYGLLCHILIIRQTVHDDSIETGAAVRAFLRNCSCPEEQAKEGAYYVPQQIIELDYLELMLAKANVRVLGSVQRRRGVIMQTGGLTASVSSSASHSPDTKPVAKSPEFTRKLDESAEAVKAASGAQVPADLKYAKSHEWLRVSGDTATVGITDHAQHELTDVVFVELPAVGRVLKAGEACAVVESVKTASDIYSPVSGTVTEVNKAVVDDPALVNTESYGKGWFFTLKLANAAEADALLAPADYAKQIA